MPTTAPTESNRARFERLCTPVEVYLPRSIGDRVAYHTDEGWCAAPRRAIAAYLAGEATLDVAVYLPRWWRPDRRETTIGESRGFASYSGDPCDRCGYDNTEVRHDGDGVFDVFYECRTCGYCGNADRVAHRRIVVDYVTGREVFLGMPPVTA